MAEDKKELDNRAKAEIALTGLLNFTEANKMAALQGKAGISVRGSDGKYTPLKASNSTKATEIGAIVEVKANGETFYYKRLLDQGPTKENGTFKAIGFIQTDKDGNLLKDKNGEYHMVEALPGTTNVFDPQQVGFVNDLASGKTGNQYKHAQEFTKKLKEAGEKEIKRFNKEKNLPEEKNPTINLSLHSHSAGGANAVIADQAAQDAGFKVKENVAFDPQFVAKFVDAAIKNGILTKDQAREIFKHTHAGRLQDENGKLSNCAMCESTNPGEPTKNGSIVINGRDNNSPAKVNPDNALWGANPFFIKAKRSEFVVKDFFNPDPLHKLAEGSNALGNGAQVIPQPQIEVERTSQPQRKQSKADGFNLGDFDAAVTAFAKAFGAPEAVINHFKQEMFAMATNITNLTGLALAEAGKNNPLINYTSSSQSRTTVQHQPGGLGA